VTTLLAQGAEAAAGKADTNKKLMQLQEQIKLLQYAFMKHVQAFSSYPLVREQVEALDYRTLAFSRVLAKHFPDFATAVEAEAKLVKEETFDQLSADDDKQNNLTPDDGPLTTDHYVILTSDCSADSEQGIFRSKMDVGGAEFADLKDLFLGKKVGDTVTAKIGVHEHLVTILGARKKPDASNEAK
jgi:hypothetical protein